MICATSPAVAPEFDSLLRSLGSAFCRQADELLDLRACALSRSRPGRCVACYFALFGANRAADVMARLCPLRSWLEREIEVVARTETDAVLETLPLRLEGEDLETYCRRMMTLVRDDRAHSAEHLVLEFRFKGAAPRAA